MPVSITLIISSHNQAGPLEAILRRISHGSLRPGQIIVAEDGEDLATPLAIARVARETGLKVLHFSQPHLGFRKARILNRAIAASEGDLVVFLDGDCLPHRHFLRDHAELSAKGFFTQGRRAFIRETHVRSCLEKNAGMLRVALGGGMHGMAKGIRLPFTLIRNDRDFHGVLGCNLAVRRADLLQVNGFDEDFSGWGHEDADLAARLYANGLTRRVVHGRAIVYHLDHPPAARDADRSNRTRFETNAASGRLRCEHGLDSHTA